MGSYILFFVTALASLFIVDYLARERGWNRSRWMIATVVTGPLAIPLVYLVDAFYAIRRKVNTPKP